MNRDVKRLLGLKFTDEGHCVTADLTRLVQIFIDLASCMDVELANPKLKFSWDQTTIQSTVSYIGIHSHFTDDPYTIANVIILNEEYPFGVHSGLSVLPFAYYKGKLNR